MFDLDEALKKNPELQKDDIENIKSWIAKQPHLPDISDEMIVLFLHSCYYKIEPTKNTIDNYYTIRTTATEIFCDRNPHSEPICEAIETLYAVQLPGKTPEGYDVFFSKLNRTDPKYFDGVATMKLYNMLGDVCYKRNGVSPGILEVIDIDGSSLSHVMKHNLTCLRHNFIYLQEAFPVRLKGIHLLNVAPFINVFMNMIKPFVSAEVLALSGGKFGNSQSILRSISNFSLNFFLNIKFHEPGSDTFYEYVPKKMLPKEYGGDAPSLAELQAETRKLFDEHEAWFREDETKQRVNESKRIGKTKSSIHDNDTGLEGSFKKIEID